MRNGGTAVCLLAVVATTAGCSTQTAEPRVVDGVAVAAYRPPPGAPKFCTELAGSTHLTALPGAVGSLAAGSGDVKGRLDVSLAITDLEPVLAEVRAATGHPALETSLDDLLAALHKATQAPFADGVAQTISNGLEAVDQQVQPLCRFPA